MAAAQAVDAPGPEISKRSALLQNYAPATLSQNYAGGWSLERIRAARDAQVAGEFRYAAPLAEAMKCDAAIFVGLLNRIAPHRGLPRVVECDDEQLAEEVTATFGRDSAALPGDMIADTHERTAMNGVWVGQNRWSARPDGSRLDVRLETWPLASTYAVRGTAKLVASTTKGAVPITHGDGKWVVAQLGSSEPWQWGAVKALAVPFGDRQLGLRDRSQHSEAHGLGHFIGQLPPGMSLDHPDAADFAQFIQALWTTRSGGTIPNGAKIELLESMAGGWQIFRELVKDESSDIFKVLLGQDGTVSNEGGNYIKAAQLYGVRQDIVESDLGIIAPAYTSGTLVPWALANFGRDIGIRTVWLFPDPDEDARRESLATRVNAYNQAISAYRANGFVVDQAFADDLASQYGVPNTVLGPVPPAAAPTFGAP